MSPDSEERQDVVAAVTSEGGHELDPWAWDLDLDTMFEETPFADGTPIDWGLVYEANREPWDPPDEPVRLVGLDWVIVFAPPGAPDPRQGGDVLETPSCFVMARIGAASLNEAQRLGAPAVRRAAGLANLLSRYIANRSPIWEGPVAPGTDDTIRFADVRRSVGVPVRAAAAVAAEFEPFTRVSVGEVFPQYLECYRAGKPPLDKMVTQACLRQLCPRVTIVVPTIVNAASADASRTPRVSVSSGIATSAVPKPSVPCTSVARQRIPITVAVSTHRG